MAPRCLFALKLRDIYNTGAPIFSVAAIVVMPRPARVVIKAYDKIIDWVRLIDAHLAARKGKRSKKDVAQFHLNLAYNIGKLQQALTSFTYKVGGYHHFKVFEPKERDIEAISYGDRVLQHAICDEILIPYMEKHLIYDNAACRKQKGTLFALNRLAHFLRDYYLKFGTDGYVLKADVAKFFPSIDHAILKQKLSNIHFDYAFFKLLCIIIDSFNADTGRGLPMGNQTSQMFALFYLDSLDRLIKEKWRVKYYTRYMDDIIIIHHDKAFLQRLLEVMQQELGRLKLSFNAKTQITPLKRGIKYLGWRTVLTPTGKVLRFVLTPSKKRVFRNLKILKKQYQRHDIGFFRFSQSLASMLGHLKQGNCYKLRQVVSKVAMHGVWIPRWARIKMARRKAAKVAAMAKIMLLPLIIAMIVTAMN